MRSNPVSRRKSKQSESLVKSANSVSRSVLSGAMLSVVAMVTCPVGEFSSFFQVGFAACPRSGFSAIVCLASH